MLNKHFHKFDVFSTLMISKYHGVVLCNVFIVVHSLLFVFGCGVVMNLLPFCPRHKSFVVMTLQHVLIKQTGAACVAAVSSLHFCCTAVALCPESEQ